MNADKSLKLARRFIELPVDKRHLFLDGLRAEGIDFSQFPIAADVQVPDRDALSYAQQRMWFLWQLDPRSGAYNLPSAVRLSGPLDEAALEQAFACLVARHQSLRTVFAEGEDGQARQVAAKYPMHVAKHSLVDLDADAQARGVRELAEHEALQPFDLAVGPLRAEPVQLAQMPPSAPALDDLSDEQLQQTVNFVIGNAIFGVYHEAARMLISDFSLPAPGGDADEADELASTMMLEANEEWLDTALVNATDSWYLSRSAEELPAHNAPLYGQLVPDKSRDRQIACLMIGKDADGYGDLAQMMGLPKADWTGCQADYPKAVAAWNDALKPHVKSPGTAKFVTNYEPARDPFLDIYATMVKESKVLDLIARGFNAYDLKGEVKLTARSCGHPDAYWSAERREITYCYELAKFHGELIAAHLLAGGNEKESAPVQEVPTAINLGQDL